ncbi:MAG: DUF2442 domain-containing protein [Planctomycetes bacterium HGW-Planctomycetes-1]|nr:MAG: DUF2442 domain-containing protein [Planctomycetes bacterium HGW-Planctomycetes-1]
MKPEVVNISQHGFWILFNGKEYFLPFEKFPWFRKASIADLTNIQLLHKTHLYWPSLDVDLSISIIESPEKYKLVAK